ncbi:TPA: DUF551 domain-containing protein [Escherichia coli]|nr:DUF551 domain-containing protein [Escherichia coli]HCO0304854.1 DUF551 domain-containing protein [Escherichia coli]HCP4882011.1 DUF551 domain-containing protein [Escherichia coli]HCP4929883.1 DUF551 domain-containing protein [Escherichia coli]HCP5070226.1 DUF551 domain-containing protein [Escherichia coli]
MTTFTDKELIKEIKERISSLDVRDNIERRAYEIALASLEADPVAYIFKHPAGKLFWALTDESNKEQADVIPVYADSPAPISSEAIENAIEYIRSIAFHIDEDDYHGKHIAYFMRQALAWLEGHSCSDDRLGKAENQTVHGNQAAESNRGNEWTGNPDIDNAIIMLDRIDTAESYDDDRIEAVKAVLRRLAGNSPVTPDGWISCSERMPNDAQWCVVNTEYGYYVQCWSEGQGWLGDDISIPECDVINWMPLPEPPKEVNRG